MSGPFAKTRASVVVGTIVLVVIAVGAARYVPRMFAVRRAQHTLDQYVGRRAAHDELAQAAGIGGWNQTAASFRKEWPGVDHLVVRHPEILTALGEAAEVSVFTTNQVVCMVFRDGSGTVKRVICYEQ